MPYVRRLPSGKWQATVKHPSGRRYTRTDPLKRVVSDWGDELELQIRRGTFIDPNAGKMTVTTWWHRWDGGRSIAPATRAKAETHWRLYLEPAFGTWPLGTITPHDVRTWVVELQRRDVRPEALATAVRLLRQLLEVAVADRLLAENPAKDVRAPRVPRHVDRVLDIEEADRLVAAIVMPDRSVDVPVGVRRLQLPDLGNQLFVRLLLDCGLRWQEAAGLHVFRVDLGARVLRVREVIERSPAKIRAMPKTSAGERVVPLTDELATLMSAHLAGRPRDGLVFTSPDGEPLNYSNWLKRVWNPAVKASGLADPQPTPHDCRHSYGTWLAEAGVPVTQIQALMGHSSLRAVERYLHASQARLNEARQALDARRGRSVSEAAERIAAGG